MADKAVLSFLEEHNRPYSLTDIQNGIKGDLGKSAIQKALDSLVAKEDVREKVYGKQKVYFVSQNTDVSPSEHSEQIMSLDRKINEVTLNLQEKSDKIKANMALHQKVKGRMTLPEAIEKKVELETDFRAVKNALKEFAQVEPVTEEVKKKVQAKYDKYLDIYKKRRRTCLDILDPILENYPKTKKNLYEEIGIETDEDSGFNMDKL